MTVEFLRNGHTYRSTVATVHPPPAELKIPFRATTLGPTRLLVLTWERTDEERGVELYKPGGWTI